MKSKLYGKILVVGIIVLFIGVSVSSAISIKNKTSNSDNEKHIIAQGEIYENTNCFIIGSVSEAFNGVYIFGKGDIVFGFKFNDVDHHSDGWIYTNGDNGKWLYSSILKDGFLGNVSSYRSTDWWSGLWVTFYVGIEGFSGLALGGHPKQEPIKDPIGAHCWFIGHADHVKIYSA
jgi:hypothetical protein